ncbi:26S proteasome non-ATPase regulatory subunit 1-like protein [Smittium mucronatum]|uniref:26S proteasome regulatory subunit RPN2 n=1 Tax=Smittium mucronatum TaxID=133383 RepID=A0A1R0GVA0_9FUNG|nr:26S proteasome non-ATPase regulatory subunit 1-like protein [Smittium mucronatum]
MTTSLTSANSFISLLNESDPELLHYGLTSLNQNIELFWAEISDHVAKIDSLYFALGAGQLFDLREDSEYVKTIVNKAIEEYIALRNSEEIYKDEKTAVFNKRLTDLVEGVFQRSIKALEYNQAIGLAIDSRRLDILEKILSTDSTGELFIYVQKHCLEFVNQIDYRAQIFELLVKVLLDSKKIDYSTICHILAALDDPARAAEQLINLALSNEEGELVAMQVAFDSEETSAMDFLLSQKAVVDSKLQEKISENDAASAKILETLSKILDGSVRRKLQLEFYFTNNHSNMAILNKTNSSLDSRSSFCHSALSISNAYMHSGTTVDLFLRNNLDWLSRASNWSKFTATAALGVIHKGQTQLGMSLMEPYLPQDGVSSSVYSESGAFYALGLIYSRTGDPKIIDYLQQALTSYQGKDSDVLQHGACLGLGLTAMGFCRSDLYDSLRSVLYTDSAVAGEAAGVAMGLLMIGSGTDSVIDDMLTYARETTHEKIIRGLSIGMSLVVYGIRDDAELLIKELCDDEDPILRYAGVLAITSAYCASGTNSAIKRLLHMAVSDVNDDVRRASVIGLGFLLLRTPEQVPRMVELLSGSYNPHVRFGSAMALGIALAGSGSLGATEILEPMLKDSVDFVRQGAFIAMSMVLMQHNDSPSQNSSSTGNNINPIPSNNVAKFKSNMVSTISNKHEEFLSKVGAVMGQGIIDAGGRNATIKLISKSSGMLNVEAFVGMFLTTQFWSWLPLSHMLSLSFAPTGLIAITKDLKVPKLNVSCNGKPSLYSYPAEAKDAVIETYEHEAPVALSFSSKAKGKIGNTSNDSAKKIGQSSEDSQQESMDIDEIPESKNSSMELNESPASSKMQGSPASKQKKTKTANSDVFSVANFSRVLPWQEQYITWPLDSRFVPVLHTSASAGIEGIMKTTNSGFIVVVDKSPELEIEVVSSAIPSVEGAGESAENELEVPEPFQYPFGRD